MVTITLKWRIMIPKNAKKRIIAKNFTKILRLLLPNTGVVW